MKVVIIGGTGLIGRKLAENLQAQGLTVIAASPSKGVDSVTGVGLGEALEGADVIVDVSNSPSFEESAVLEFFRRSTTNLLATAKAAGVKHYVALSVVGAERIHDSPYLRAKNVQESLIAAGDVPFTIVRATQFFEFMDAIAGTSTADGSVRLPTAKFQPVAAADVAATLARIVTEAPKNGALELAGPEASTVAGFVKRYLELKGDARNVVADESAKYFGAALDQHGLAPAAEFITAPTRLSDWLRAT